MKKIIPIAVLLCISFLIFNAFKKEPTRQAVIMPPNACDNLTGVAKLVCLADEFKALLTASQIATLQKDHTLANAVKWSNFPINIYTGRIGLRFDALNATQLAKAKELIQAAMGTTPNEGYQEYLALLAADKYLGQNGGGSNYGEGLYYIAFLGVPSMTGTWELQTGGHHLAVANTYSNGVMTGATPSFRASEPFSTFTIDGTSYAPMVGDRDALAAILASFSTSELATAKVTTTFNDIVLGPQKDWQFPTTKLGIKCSQLTTAQKNLVLAGIRTYVEDVDPANAASIMAIYTSQINDTYVAYSNTAALSAQRDYIRIDGPRVWIEYSTQNGIVLSGTHPHSVWRDRVSDYGGLGNPSVGTNGVKSFEGKFEVSPNPTTANAQVSIELKKGATVALSVFDMSGKKVSEGLKLNMTAGEHTLPLDAQHLPKGIYNCVLEVKNADGATAVASKQLSKI
jgi:Protein of unknown function (DUF3500)/Secretion system C-terminal sorting domain